MAPRFEQQPQPAREPGWRADGQAAQDPVELATQLVMLPAEVVWSMFGRALVLQARALLSIPRGSAPGLRGQDPGLDRSTSRRTDIPR
jgi:hypothetical protein